jgi:flagellar motor protein MotB
MSKKVRTALAVALLGASAAGCMTTDLRARVDELTREREELKRQKAAVEADLLELQARHAAYERGERKAGPPAAASSADVPEGLPGKVDIRRRGNDTAISLPSDVFFSSGSSAFAPSIERAMAQVADYIRKNHPDGMIHVEGHSDSDPIRRTKSKYHCNWELSFERAHAVMHYLVDKGGFDPRRVVCEAFGEFQPQDPADKARNRRVEIVIARR